MRYISPEDIHVYSIDECFIDATGYLNTYHMTAHELAMTMIREVLYETGITATAGIGTNLYLAKVAMDIVAKHVPADKDGVRIAELDEMKYRELLWCHTPLTDFWGIGGGTAARVGALGCATMGDIARLSTINEDLLYKALGVKAEIVIDHAWGWEPTEIATIETYRPSTNSLSSGQVLKEPYNASLARLIVREMTELLVLDMVKKYVVTKKITLTIGYDRESLQLLRHGRTPKEDVYKVKTTGNVYDGKVSRDHYGRVIPYHAHGTGNLEGWTSSTAAIAECMMQLYHNKYPFSGIIICGECGGKFKRQTQSGGIAWACSTHLYNKDACSMMFIKDEAIKAAFVTMMNKLIFGCKQVLVPYYDSLRLADTDESLQGILDLKNELQRNSDRKNDLRKLRVKGFLDAAMYNQELRRVEMESEEIRAKMKCFDRAGENGDIKETKKLLRFAESAEMLTEFSDDLFTEYVDSIIVYTRTCIGFRLRCGLTLKEEVCTGTR